MMMQPQALSFATCYQRLSGVERAFVDEFVTQVATQARRGGTDLCTVLERLPASGVDFDWRTREFLSFERVTAAIRERCIALDQAAVISQDRIRQEIAAIAFSSFESMTAPDPLDPEARILTPNDWTPEQWASVEEFTVEEMAQGGRRKYKIKLASKLTALKMLGDHAGLFDPNNPHRIKETAREVVKQTEAATFAKETPLATVQEAYARLLVRNA